MVSDDVKRLTTPVVKDVFRLDGHDVPVEVPKMDESESEELDQSTTRMMLFI